MSASPGNRWDRAREAFADQFEQAGTNLVYRRSQKGEAIRVSAAERSKFIDEFDRHIRHANWIIYIGVALVVGGVILFPQLSHSDLPQGAIFAGIGLVMVPYFAYYRWAWAAPARELAGRTPIAGERSSEEVQRIRFRRMTYGQLAGAAFAGLVLPFLVGSYQTVLSGWNRLWLVFGGAIVLFSAAQAFRKWRFEQEDSFRNVIRPSYNPRAAEPLEEASSQTAGPLWRYLPLAILVLGFLFIAFTSVGKQLAQKPSFVPTLMIGLAGWALFTVATAFTKGRIQPLARGFSNTYEREAEPKRFWASVAWNALFGGFCLWAGLTAFRDVSPQGVQDRCYNQYGNFSTQDSLEACTLVIEGKVPPGHLSMADAYVYRATADEGLGNRSRALADYTQAIRLKPTDYYSYFNRGLIFLDAMRSDQAVADFTRAHELNPKSPWPLADRGMAYAWKNDRPRAEADFAAVRSIDHANIAVLHGEGVLDMNAGDLEGAIKEFTDALRRDPLDGWSIQMRADAYQQMGEFEKARQDREQLLKMSRSSAEHPGGSS